MKHTYLLKLQWTGNTGRGTADYRAYTRDHVISVENKPELQGSSDPHFRGDKTRYNPEELLIAALSACHMLSYLHLCADAGIVVVDYVDQPTGTMVETAGTGGHFTEVTLYPTVTITDSVMVEKAQALHAEANKLCFIANSVNFKVGHKPVCKVL